MMLEVKPVVERMSPTLDDLLQGATNLVQRRIAEAIRERGCGDVGLAAVRCLRMVRPGCDRIVDLAAEAGVSKQAIGQIVKQLVQDDFVQLRSDPDDRRSRRIVLTDRGLALRHAASEVFGRIDAEVRVLLGGDELAALRYLLSRIGDLD